MIPDQVYILLLRGRPLKAFTCFEAANEAMAEYVAEMQRDMEVLTMELVSNDKS
jgi:hypothetical protein